jgi:putative membrane protein
MDSNRRQMSSQSGRFLILCVDRDDDLGVKARVQTPVVGRDAALAAATKLALADPEEADANAIFAAVRKYDDLVKAGTDCDVAVVCGDNNRGFEADRRVGAEVAKVVASGEFTGVVLVSDGGEDEQVIPIIQSIRPIVSVQRVAVKHSQTVEETYEVLGRYLRMLVFDPHYSKWTLGLPGVIFILAGVLVLSGQVYEAELATLLILGGAFFIRGFNVDRTVVGLLQRGPTGYIRLFSMVGSVIVIITGVFSGYTAMDKNASSYVQAVLSNPGNLLVYGGALAGYLINGSVALVFSGIAIYATGALLSHVARDSARWRRDGFVLLMLTLLYFPVQIFSQFLIQGAAQSSFLLVSFVLLGLAVIFALTTIIYPRVRTRAPTDTD